MNQTFKELISATVYGNKVKEIKECRRYIKNNWEGIINYYNEKNIINCSAEGHVSHILSDRLNSRPLGWSVQGANQMACLRAYTANGGDVYELFKKGTKKQKSRKF